MKTLFTLKPASMLLWLVLLITSSFGNASESLQFEVPEGSLLLKEAFRIALDNNPSIDQVEQRILKADATIKRVRSYMMPSVDINGSSMFRNVSTYPETMPTTRVTRDYHEFTAGATFAWRFYQGLQDLEYLRAAKKGLEVAKLVHRDAQRILLDQVAQTFIQSEAAKVQMVIARSNFEFNQRLLENAKIRFELGEMREADVLNFELGLNQAETAFLTAQKQFETANAVLAMLLGDENGQLSPDQYPLVSDEVSVKTLPDTRSLIAQAFKDRPDVKAMEVSLESFAHQEKALKGNFMPTLDMLSGVSYSNNQDFTVIDQEESYSYIGVRMNWNLFDGGRKKAQVIEMRADKLAQLQQLLQLRNQVSAELQQDVIALQNAYALLDRRREAEAFAHRIRDFVEEAYLSGEVTITRLNEAQNNWVAASNAYLIAKLQVLQGQYSIEASTGSILEGVSIRFGETVG